jgi:hypothetical protein
MSQRFITLFLSFITLFLKGIPDPVRCTYDGPGFRRGPELKLNQA